MIPEGQAAIDTLLNEYEERMGPYPEPSGDDVRCRVAVRGVKGSKRLTTYRCTRGVDRAEVDVEWYKWLDSCVLFWVGVRPYELHGRGFGSQSLYHELEEMSRAGCKEIAGEAAYGAEGFWGRLVELDENRQGKVRLR